VNLPRATTSMANIESRLQMLILNAREPDKLSVAVNVR
jgi:hypothetical protein